MQDLDRPGWRALLRDVLGLDALTARLTGPLEPERQRRYDRCWEEAQRLATEGTLTASGPPQPGE